MALASLVVAVALGVGAGGHAGTGFIAGKIAYLALEDAYWQVWVMEPDGSGARQVTSSVGDKTRCSWHPSGLELLVSTLAGRVLRVDVETGGETVVPVPQEGTMDAVLSPDGSQIAYALSTAGSVDDHEIWIVGIGGEDVQRATDMPGLQHGPSWDPSGKSIYFLSSRREDESHDIWRLSLEDGSREQLTAGSLYHFGVAARQNGEIAFSSNRSGDYEIYSQRGHDKAVRWTDAPGLDGGPSWGPVGLAYHAVRRLQPQIFRLSEPMGKPRQLTRHKGGARHPAWWTAKSESR